MKEFNGFISRVYTALPRNEAASTRLVRRGAASRDHRVNVTRRRRAHGARRDLLHVVRHAEAAQRIAVRLTATRVRRQRMRGAMKRGRRAPRCCASAPRLRYRVEAPRERPVSRASGMRRVRPRPRGSARARGRVLQHVGTRRRHRRSRESAARAAAPHARAGLHHDVPDAVTHELPRDGLADAAIADQHHVIADSSSSTLAGSSAIGPAGRSSAAARRGLPPHPRLDRIDPCGRRTG